METDEVHDKARFHMQYQTFNGRFKFVCMLLLILSEYLFLVWHTCINSPIALTTLYPYAAVFLTVFIGVTYYGYNVCFPNFEILSVIVFDFVSYCGLLTGMISVCGITLRGCARYAGFYYFLPEILGLLTAVMLLVNSVFWFCKHYKTFKEYYMDV